MSLGCCTDRQLRERAIAQGRPVSQLPKGCDETTCMRLPEGQSCGTCVHLMRCLAMGFTNSAERASCDFFPRRFVEAAALAETTARA